MKIFPNESSVGGPAAFLWQHILHSAYYAYSDLYFHSQISVIYFKKLLCSCSSEPYVYYQRFIILQNFISNSLTVSEIRFCFSIEDRETNYKKYSSTSCLYSQIHHPKKFIFKDLTNPKIWFCFLVAQGG